MDDDFAGGIAEDLPDALIQVEFLGGEVEAGGLRLPGIGFLLEGEGLHGVFLFFCCWYQRFSGHRVPPFEARYSLCQAGLWPNPRSIGLGEEDAQSTRMDTDRTDERLNAVKHRAFVPNPCVPLYPPLSFIRVNPRRSVVVVSIRGRRSQL